MWTTWLWCWLGFPAVRREIVGFENFEIQYRFFLSPLLSCLWFVTLIWPDRPDLKKFAWLSVAFKLLHSQTSKFSTDFLAAKVVVCYIDPEVVVCPS
jgi:hypothetical protein